MAKDCPECTYTDTAVYDSRPTFFSGYVAIRRRRKCPACKHKLTTCEISEANFHALTASRMKAIEAKISDNIVEKYLRKHADEISRGIACDIEGDESRGG